MLKVNLAVIALLMITHSANANAEDKPLTVKQFNQLQLSDSRKFSNDFYEKEYLVEGIGKYGFECPPCPAGAMCEPCAPTMFILSDETTPSEELHVPYSEDHVSFKPNTWAPGTRVRVRAKIKQQFTVDDIKAAQ